VYFTDVEILTTKFSEGPIIAQKNVDGVPSVSTLHEHGAGTE
jgi:hypothetical protein